MNRKKKVHTHKNNYDICKSSNIQKKKKKKFGEIFPE